MRLSWVLLLIALPFALSTCGADSNSDNEDGDSGETGGSSNGGTGLGGTNAGDAGAPSSGASSSGTTGEAGAAGEGTGTGGSSGAGGSAGSAGTGGCDERPVDVLILLDRSASMQEPPELNGIPGETSKWELAIPPLLDAISTSSPIRWGLKIFPIDEEPAAACSAGSVPVGADIPVGTGNVEAVRQAILATTPQGDGTPTGDAIDAASAYLQTMDSEGQKFILLVTDGVPSCINVTPTSDGVEGREQARPYALRAATDAFDVGHATFFLGIGANLELERATLDELALAGGRPAPTVNPLEPLYYLANDTDAVASAMDSIISSASLCTAPPFPSLRLPYADDFETSEAADWRFTSVPWTVTDDGGNNVLQLSSTGDAETTWAVGGDRGWTDVRVEMRVKFVSGEAMILLSPRFADLDNYAFVEYEASDSPKLRRRLAGSTSDIITAPQTLTFAPGQWHTVAVTLQGTNATLEFDGVVLGMATDSTPVPRGGIGIAVENGIVAIDDVRVTAP